MIKLLLVVIFILGCETFDVTADNPLDPNNPDYEIPTISVLNLQNGQTITSDNLNISLEGNENVVEYSYNLKSSDSYKDMGNTWSSWSTTQVISLEYLNEFGYTLTVKSRYLTGEESKDLSLEFSVDAVQPGSLLLYPKQLEAEIYKNIKIQLFAHQLSNVSALDFVIEYDYPKLTLASSQGSAEYGDINVVRSLSNNQIRYTIGKYGQSGFGENELIADIVFNATGGPYSNVKISSITAKSLDGQTIEIAGSNQVRVDLK